jgi:hypothetical protein
LKAFIEISFYVFLKTIKIKRKEKIPQNNIKYIFKRVHFWPKIYPIIVCFHLVDVYIQFMNFGDFIDDAKIYVIYVQRGYISFKHGTIHPLGYKSY